MNVSLPPLHGDPHKHRLPGARPSSFRRKAPPPGRILNDITLDGSLEGIETARQIRKKYAIPVIFLTAHSNGLIIARAKEVSSYGYIVKPVLEKDLFEHVERALRRNSPDTCATVNSSLNEKHNYCTALATHIFTIFPRFKALMHSPTNIAPPFFHS